jgi:hypothetical protein
MPSNALLRGITLAVALGAGACGGAGARALAVDGSPETTLPSWGDGAPALAVPIPADFVVKSQKGNDFDVHYVALEGRRAADAHGTIYVGHNPNLFHKQRKDEVSGVTTAQETIAGQSVPVYSFATSTQGSFHKEAVLASVFAKAPGDGIRGLRVHIACGGASRERVEDLWGHLIRIHAK